MFEYPWYTHYILMNCRSHDFRGLYLCPCISYVTCMFGRENRCVGLSLVTKNGEMRQKCKILLLSVQLYRESISRRYMENVKEVLQALALL